MSHRYPDSVHGVFTKGPLRSAPDEFFEDSHTFREQPRRPTAGTSGEKCSSPSARRSGGRAAQSSGGGFVLRKVDRAIREIRAHSDGRLQSLAAIPRRAPTLCRRLNTAEVRIKSRRVMSKISVIRPVQIRFTNASVQQPLFMQPLPFPLSSRAYPDFLLHSSRQRHFCGSPQREPHAVDRSHNSRQEIRGSERICSSADLSWKRGSLYANNLPYTRSLERSYTAKSSAITSCTRIEGTSIRIASPSFR